MKTTVDRLSVFAALICLFIASAAPGQGMAAQKASPATKGPQAYFPAPRFEAQEIEEGIDIKHDFIIENHGDAPLVIESVRPD